MKRNFSPDDQSDILITCLPGLGDVLSDELEAMGKHVASRSSKFAMTSGSFHQTYELNYHLRTASHVHYKVTGFNAKNAQDLYKQAKQFSWEDIMQPDSYFSVQSVVKNDSIKDNRFANLKLKDAIADRFMEKMNRRPDSGPDTGHIVIYLHWMNEQVSIYIDTSGDSLSRRGYRKDPWKAPLAESLAAGIVLSTNWDRKSTFLNPMGGSGSLIIEALLISRKIPPGSFKNKFGFMSVKGYDPEKWQALKVSPEKYLEVNYPVIYNDNKRFAHKALERNLQATGMEKIVRTHLGDFEKMRIPENPGVVIINPPYGERLGEIAELEETYRRIGEFFKQKCVNYTGYVFTANLDLAKHIGLRTSSKKHFQNGKLEAKLLEYPLYEGSKKSG